MSLLHSFLEWEDRYCLHALSGVGLVGVGGRYSGVWPVTIDTCYVYGRDMDDEAPIPGSAAGSMTRPEDKILYDLLVYCKWPEIAAGVVGLYLFTMYP